MGFKSRITGLAGHGWDAVVLEPWSDIYLFRFVDVGDSDIVLVDSGGDFGLVFFLHCGKCFLSLFLGW